MGIRRVISIGLLVIATLAMMASAASAHILVRRISPPGHWPACAEAYASKQLRGRSGRVIAAAWLQPAYCYYKDGRVIGASIGRARTRAIGSNGWHVVKGSFTWSVTRIQTSSGRRLWTTSLFGLFFHTPDHVLQMKICVILHGGVKGVHPPRAKYC